MTRDELPDSIFARESVPEPEDYAVPRYTVTMQIQCDLHPQVWLLDHIYQYLESDTDNDEYARILHIEPYQERPTTIEHHGGYPIPPRY